MLNSDDAQNWQKAMDDQMRALQENNTFVFTDSPKGKQVVGVDGYVVSKEILSVQSSRPDMSRRALARYVV